LNARKQSQPTTSRFRTGRKHWLLLPAALACLSLNGCVSLFWDDVTSRDFTIKGYFTSPPDPMYVINNSTDGDKRAKAFRMLREPLANGGTQKDQDAVVTVLVNAAANDRQALCRMAAIQALRDFKDPRAVEGLKDAYYKSENFPKEQMSGSIIRCQALAALGQTRNPAALDLLVKVLKEPPIVGDDQEQQKMDEREQAARALGYFNTEQAKEALFGVMKTEQDIGMRKCVYDSLVASTGRHLPDDPQVWDDYLHKPHKDGEAIPGEPGFFDRMMEILPVNFWN